MGEIIYKEESFKIIGLCLEVRESKLRLGLLVNFGEDSLVYKRIVL